MKIKTKKAVKDFIVSNGNCVTTSKGKKYYYLPYYYEDCGNGVFDEIQYTALPTEVIKEIEKIRDTPKDEGILYDTTFIDESNGKMLLDNVVNTITQPRITTTTFNDEVNGKMLFDGKNKMITKINYKP